MKPLKPAFDIDEAAAFLGRGATGQEVMGERGGRVREDIAHDQQFQALKELRADAAPRDVLSDHDQAAQASVADASRDGGQPAAQRRGGNPDQLAPAAVGIHVGVDEETIGIAQAGDGVRDSLGVGGQAFQKVKFLVGLAGGGNDGKGAGRDRLESGGDLTHVGYFAYTKDLTICNNCGSVSPLMSKLCPNCSSDNVEWWSRVTGYYQAVSGWNEAKKRELNDRFRVNV